jgi:hemerythrin-like domain-containing protein
MHEMTSPRMNIYGFPHKGLRNALSQLQFETSKVDISSDQDVSALKALSETVVTLLELHQDAEDSVMLPDIEARAPGSTTHNAREHERLHAMVEAIAHHTQLLTVGAGAGAHSELFDAINAFISDYLTHMAEEEHEVNATIWQHFSDDEILGWQGQIMGKLTPEQKMLWFRFIIPALTPFEREIMLGGVRANVPAETYAAILEMLSQYMPEHELAPLKAITH